MCARPPPPRSWRSNPSSNAGGQRGPPDRVEWASRERKRSSRFGSLPARGDAPGYPMSPLRGLSGRHAPVQRHALPGRCPGRAMPRSGGDASCVASFLRFLLFFLLLLLRGLAGVEGNGADVPHREQPVAGRDAPSRPTSVAVPPSMVVDSIRVRLESSPSFCTTCQTTSLSSVLAEIFLIFATSNLRVFLKNKVGISFSRPDASRYSGCRSDTLCVFTTILSFVVTTAGRPAFPAWNLPLGKRTSLRLLFRARPGRSPPRSQHRPYRPRPGGSPC